MNKLSEVAELTLGADGIWYPRRDGLSAISYPADANARCFEAESDSYWFNHRNQVILQSIKRTGLRIDWLLDIGGGNGAVASFLERSGIKSVVLEPGHDGARNSLSRGVSAVINSTLEEALIRPASVSAAGLFDVLEHIEDDLDMLSKIKTCLRPGGHVIIAVPAYQFLWSESDIEAGHFRRYTKRELTHRLTAAGFRVVYASYFFTSLIVPILLFRALKSRIGKKVEAKENISGDHGTQGGVLVAGIRFLLMLERAWFKVFSSLPIGASLIVIGEAPVQST
jgi:SAM-dependent methyltransferase